MYVSSILGRGGRGMGERVGKVSVGIYDRLGLRCPRIGLSIWWRSKVDSAWGCWGEGLPGGFAGVALSGCLPRLLLRL